jgi:hypothetical protein
MKKWIISILFVTAVTLIAIWAVSRLIGTSQAEQPVMKMSAAVSPTQESMQDQLMDPNLDQQSREMLIEKIELEKRSETDKQAGIDNPAPKVPSVQADKAVIPAQLQVETGIFEGSEGMVRSERAVISNYWQGVVNGKVYIAFAGAKPGENAQGVIVLAIASLDPAVNEIAFEEFLAPGTVGKLRVIDAKDGIVVLQQVNGGQLKFDLTTKKFMP